MSPRATDHLSRSTATAGHYRRQDWKAAWLLGVTMWAWAIVPGPALAQPMAGTQAQEPPALTLRAGKSVWMFTDAELRARATETLISLKGTRKKPAIRLSTLVRETKLTPDEIDMIFVIGEIVTILRGPDLANLDKLMLATGPDKGARRHDWALAAENERAYMKLSPTIGQGRKHAIYRMDIVLKSDRP